jgi:hypothetical protein
MTTFNRRKLHIANAVLKRLVRIRAKTLVIVLIFSSMIFLLPLSGLSGIPQGPRDFTGEYVMSPARAITI